MRVPRIAFFGLVAGVGSLPVTISERQPGLLRDIGVVTRELTGLLPIFGDVNNVVDNLDVKKRQLDLSVSGPEPPDLLNDAFTQIQGFSQDTVIDTLAINRRQDSLLHKIAVVLPRNVQGLTQVLGVDKRELNFPRDFAPPVKRRQRLKGECYLIDGGLYACVDFLVEEAEDVLDGISAAAPVAPKRPGTEKRQLNLTTLQSRPVFLLAAQIAQDPVDSLHDDLLFAKDKRQNNLPIDVDASIDLDIDKRQVPDVAESLIATVGQRYNDIFTAVTDTVADAIDEGLEDPDGLLPNAQVKRQLNAIIFEDNEGILNLADALNPLITEVDLKEKRVLEAVGVSAYLDAAPMVGGNGPEIDVDLNL